MADYTINTTQKKLFNTLVNLSVPMNQKKKFQKPKCNYNYRNR